MTAVMLIAARELRARLRSRAFAISTVAIVALVLAAVIIPALDDRTTTFQAGLTGATPAALATALQDSARADGARLELDRPRSVAAGEAAVRDGDLDVLVVGGRQLVWKGEPQTRLAAIVGGALQRVEVARRAETLGLSPAQTAALLAPAAAATRRLEPAQADQDAREVIAAAGLMLLLGVLLGYGASIAEGVAQEKGGRIVELLLCRVRARDLLAGKVLGIGLVGLSQLLLALVAAAVAIVALDAVDVPHAVPAMLVTTVGWFVLGFAFWSVAFAAVGALVSRAEEVQSAYSPLSWLLIAAYFVGVVVTQTPDAWYARAATLFPLTAPMTVPVRVATGSVPAWEHVAAVLIMVGATYALIRLAATVYAGGLLRTGARSRPRDVWRALRVRG